MEPAAAVQAVGGVSAAVGASVGDERKALADSPPEVPRCYGLSPTDRSAGDAAREASTEKGLEKEASLKLIIFA